MVAPLVLLPFERVLSFWCCKRRCRPKPRFPIAGTALRPAYLLRPHQIRPRAERPHPLRSLNRMQPRSLNTPKLMRMLEERKLAKGSALRTQLRRPQSESHAKKKTLRLQRPSTMATHPPQPRLMVKSQRSESVLREAHRLHTRKNKQDLLRRHKPEKPNYGLPANPKSQTPFPPRRIHQQIMVFPPSTPRTKTEIMKLYTLHESILKM